MVMPAVSMDLAQMFWLRGKAISAVRRATEWMSWGSGVVRTCAEVLEREEGVGNRYLIVGSSAPAGYLGLRDATGFEAVGAECAEDCCAGAVEAADRPEVDGHVGG